MKKTDGEAIHIIRMGDGAFQDAVNKKVKFAFYRLNGDGEYDIIDNRRGKMLKYTCKTLEECVACVNI